MIARSYHIIYIALALFASFAPAHAQINAEQVMRVGQNAIYFEDYVLSIQYFNQAIQAKPYLATPYLYRAIAKLNLDDFRGAEEDASKAVEINPFLTDAWEVRGVARQNSGRLKEAISDYKEALNLLPRNRQILFNMAMAQTDAKDFAAADSTFSDLLRFYPGFDNGYLGRAKLRLATADTIGASSDIDRALSINKNAVNGYILRADIAISSGRNYKAALEDMDRAVKLEPKLTGLYINRAFLRYNLDDYFGAMADYDYALQLEPLNRVALFNRALLLQEVGDNDRALVDYTQILKLDPDDYRAIYNRAVVNGEKHNFSDAIADINKIIDRFPDFASALFMRSDFYRQKGDINRARTDYNRALALSKKPIDDSADSEERPTDTADLDPSTVAKRFNSLLTIDNDTHIDEEYNNSAIRGKVQNRDINIETEPLIELSFYTAPGELANDNNYIKEIDDINASRILRFAILVTSHVPILSDVDIIDRHFESINYYDSYIATHTPRAIDFIGRALDQITVRNYAAAISDLDRAIALTPDNPVPYLLRAQARYHIAHAPSNKSSGMPTDLCPLCPVLSDYDMAVELAPRSAVAWFNKGNIHLEQGDLTSALAAFNRAIDLKPDMGQAFYNRGYVYLKLGNQPLGIADLSKAGELGIASAYNLIKRISR